MIKKLLLALIFVGIFAQSVFAQEIFRVTSVNFDTSNSMIFITSPDNTVEPILSNIKLMKLSNPNRAFFDINSAILTTPPQNWYLNSSGLKQIKIGQYSTNPNVIRVVLYFEEGFNPQKIKFMKINNNIAIKLNEEKLQSDYFQNTYRDEHSISSDFYENLSISNQENSKVQIAANIPKSTVMLNDIQQAFNSSIAPDASIKQVSVPKIPEIKKELKLKSKYYLSGIHVKPNGVLISGFGAIGIERPMYLTDPARVVFDIPASVVDPDLKNKEFKINEKDSVRVGQFLSNKTRIVITSDELEKYIPIFSADNQSMFIVNSDNVDLDSLFTKTTDAVSYYYKSLDKTTDEFIIAFNAPVVHSVRRDATKATIYFYNALRYNDITFKSSINSTSLSGINMDLMPKIGLKLTVPLQKDSVLNCYLGADAKSIKIKISGTKAVPIVSSVPASPIVKKVYTSQCKNPNSKRVVLDPGHGGSDYGAIREGINEKDINLDISKRVEAILLSKGISVDMTRQKDETVSLQDRTYINEAVSPDVFVSIHVNSSLKPEITGIETHYYQPNSINLAQTVHSCLASSVKSNDRGLFKSRFYVINHTTAPAVLVEIGFISNARERADLLSEQRKQQTAKAIADGILKYLNIK